MREHVGPMAAHEPTQPIGGCLEIEPVKPEEKRDRRYLLYIPGSPIWSDLKRLEETRTLESVRYFYAEHRKKIFAVWAAYQQDMGKKRTGR